MAGPHLTFGCPWACSFSDVGAKGTPPGQLSWMCVCRLQPVLSETMANAEAGPTPNDHKRPGGMGAHGTAVRIGNVSGVVDLLVYVGQLHVWAA